MMLGQRGLNEVGGRGEPLFYFTHIHSLSGMELMKMGLNRFNTTSDGRWVFSKWIGIVIERLKKANSRPHVHTATRRNEQKGPLSSCPTHLRGLESDFVLHTAQEIIWTRLWHEVNLNTAMNFVGLSH